MSQLRTFVRDSLGDSESTADTDSVDSAGSTDSTTPSSSAEDAPRPSQTGASADDEANETQSQTVAVRSTGRWRGIVAVVLLAAAVGALAARPSLLLVAAVVVAVAAYPRSTATPDPALSVSRTLDAEETADDAISVTTTVTNDGDSTLFDLRIVDGTPPLLSVSGGSPRCATTVAPGEEVTLNYELQLRPGRHRFQPTTLLCRDSSGSVEVETTVTVDTEIKSETRLPAVPLGPQHRHWSGPLTTDAKGSGLEFHSVDEYESGDPANRIDWRRYARTGELTSVEFRTERLADVVICIDARAEAYRASDGAEPHAVAHAVDAAERIGEWLFAANHRVGLAAFGREQSLLPPGSGRDHADRFRRRLTTEPALSLAPPQPARTTDQRPTSNDTQPDAEATPNLDSQLSALEAQLDSDTQLLIITPGCDDEAIRAAHRFETTAAVTVISPDVTTGETAGGLIARVEREQRLTALRNAGIPTVDWDPETPLGSALAAIERWQR